MLKNNFYNRDTVKVARELLGKILCVRFCKPECKKDIWLMARIIETEAYCSNDKASHGSLGYTEKRKALFMSPGTIYMYHSRGNPSLNVSSRGEGNAVLIKSGMPFFSEKMSEEMRLEMLDIMHLLNPKNNGAGRREIEKLCSGQTLLCKSLGLTVKEWDQKQFDRQKFYIGDAGINVENIIATTRLGIPIGRDEHLPYRFIDQTLVKYCTKRPNFE